MPPENRFILLDALRGAAVLLMIFFHAAYDLNWFGFINIDIINGPFWFALPRFIVFLFLICVGMSLALVHKRGIRWRPAIKRFVIIGGWAMVITAVTVVFFPKNYIFFGALHCIAATSLAGVFFVGRPKLSLVLCIVLVVPYMIFRPTLIPIAAWLGVAPLDYIPFYPWFGFVLLGICLETTRLQEIPIGSNIAVNCLKFMGKHALLLYLLHRPFLVGTVFLLYKLRFGS